MKTELKKAITIKLLSMALYFVPDGEFSKQFSIFIVNHIKKL